MVMIYRQPFCQGVKKFSLQLVAQLVEIFVGVKGGYSIIFASNVFHNSHLFQKCIQNQQLLLILHTLLNQMRVVKNIQHKDDRMNSL